MKTLSVINRVMGGNKEEPARGSLGSLAKCFYFLSLPLFFLLSVSLEKSNSGNPKVHRQSKGSRKQEKRLCCFPRRSFVVHSAKSGRHVCSRLYIQSMLLKVTLSPFFPPGFFTFFWASPSLHLIAFPCCRQQQRISAVISFSTCQENVICDSAGFA